MNQEDKIIKTKVGLIRLARELGNVSQVCNVFGYSRDSFYRFKELYENWACLVFLDTLLSYIFKL